jgi:hypothetical protein
MFRLKIMDTANVFVLIWEFPKPRTALNIIMGVRADPYVIYEMVAKLNRVYPFQNILSAFILPHGDIVIGGTCGECIVQVQATMTALDAFKAFRWHDRLHLGRLDLVHTNPHTLHESNWKALKGHIIPYYP